MIADLDFFKDTPEPLARYGVVGWPLDHTLSPSMHTAALTAYDIPAVYRALPLPPDSWFSGVESHGLRGFNVTIPYKEKILSSLLSVSESVRRCGAANVVTVSSEGWVGNNTDALGFAQDLQDNRLPWSDARVVVVGAGGAARAAVWAFVSSPKPPRSVLVFNRHVSRAQTLISTFSDHEGLGLSENLLDDLLRADLVVNATSLGLMEGDPSPVPVGCLRRDLAVYDMIYHRPTALIQAARAVGAPAVDGLGMLVNQGALAFEIWFGPLLKKKVNYNPAGLRRIMRDAVGRG